MQNTRKTGFRGVSLGGSASSNSGVSRISLADFNAAIAEQAPSRSSVHRKRHEDGLQMACNEWLMLRAEATPVPLSFMFHPANGGFRSKAEAGRFKAMGVKRGVPDWVCPIPWRGWSGLAVEMKAESGALSDEQAWWLSGLAEAGYLVGEARTLDAFISLVEQYLDGASGHPS